ncbi:MAG: hypothetical protein AAFX10_01240, partial [Pseudomonadota bacterium]
MNGVPMSVANPGVSEVSKAVEQTPKSPSELRPAGVSIQFDAAQAEAVGPWAERLRGELKATLAERHSLAVRVVNLDRTDAVQAFRMACEFVAQAAGEMNALPASITLAVDAHDIPPAEAWSQRRTLLGCGPLYFVGTDARLESDEVLRRLWSLRSERNVGAAFWPLVASPTPLLDNETGDDLLPEPALQAPADTAWIWARVDVSANLERDLERILKAADALHARYRWPTAAARQDAWLNRRVAVELTGIGRWLTDNDLCPGKLSSLARVDALLGHASRALTRLSRRMSAGNTLPAIEARDPCPRLEDRAWRDAWRQRWRFAIERAGLGHRNLLVVSPWSLFDEQAQVAAFNLLPALRHVDACTFRRRVSIDHWNVDDHR